MVMRRSMHAFTLIEMLVSAVIVTILSGMALYCYSGALESSAVKLAMPNVAERLNTYQYEAHKYNAMITVECPLGSDELRVTYKRAVGVSYKVEKLDARGFLGRRLYWRAYKWPDGSRAPRTFTFMPGAAPQGGEVRFGTMMAEGKLKVTGSQIGWEIL